MKLGRGECPMVHSRLLGKEGQDFLHTHCFITDPEKRATAVQLLKHGFIKVKDDIQCDSVYLNVNKSMYKHDHDSSIHVGLCYCHR